MRGREPDPRPATGVNRTDSTGLSDGVGLVLGVFVDFGDETFVPFGSDLNLEMRSLELHPDLGWSFLLDLIDEAGMGCDRFESHLAWAIGNNHEATD